MFSVATARTRVLKPGWLPGYACALRRRSGGQARRKTSQRVRSTRNRVERELKARRRDVEKAVKQNRTRVEKAVKQNRVKAEDALTKAQERVTELV